MLNLAMIILLSMSLLCNSVIAHRSIPSISLIGSVTLKKPLKSIKSIQTNIQTFNDKSIKNQNDIKRNINKVIKNIPTVLYKSFVASANAFASNLIICLPFAIILNAKSFDKNNIIQWLKVGAQNGIEWAQFGAIYSGTETFFSSIRNKNDRFNTYIASGISTGLLSHKQGPVAMLKGFLMGSSLLFIFDELITKNQQTEAD